ncbi:MAG: hypothetical protein P4L98_10440 [Ancalomicrobiaceae bacterium]|nr:hypothetical protein [Ancalomicrobiaceae bacterium]
MMRPKPEGDISSAGMVFGLWMLIGAGIGIGAAIIAGVERFTLAFGIAGGIAGAALGCVSVFGTSRLSRGLWIGGVVGVCVVSLLYILWRVFGE